MTVSAVRISDVDGRGILAFDLRDVLAVFLEDAASSTWRVANLECTGTRAADLHAIADAAIEVSGGALLQIAEHIDQVIDGEFAARRPGEETPWVLIRAVDSSFFVVETVDQDVLMGIRARFADVADETNA